MSTIAFSNALPNTPPNTPEQILNSGEIYLVDPDGTNPRRLTNNQAGDTFATPSPDGKKIVFDSNRNRGAGPLNTSDLFVMNTDGTEQQHLIRGGSPTWSPDGKRIAFHASASGTGDPISTLPGAATVDSDIFIANVDDLLNGTGVPRNVTNRAESVDDDPDWSPNGQLVFTSHDVNDNHANPQTVEIYALDPDGTAEPQQLTDNDLEERSPDVSPDGTQIVFFGRQGTADFELLVINADGSGLTQLTNNTVGDIGPNWSPDGQQIVFQRPVGGGQNQLFVINPSHIDPDDPSDPDRVGTQITGRPGDLPLGWNGFVSWDLLRVRVKK